MELKIINKQNALILELFRCLVDNLRKDANNLLQAINERMTQLYDWYDAQINTVEGLVK